MKSFIKTVFYTLLASPFCGWGDHVTYELKEYDISVGGDYGISVLVGLLIMLFFLLLIAFFVIKFIKPSVSDKSLEPKSPEKRL